MSATATVTDVLGGTARWCVVEGDCAAVTRSLPDARFDAIVTDPPSGIAFMGAAWDRDKGGRLQWAAWLAGILSDARRATRDGGRALVWSLPRTSHWTGCAVEDAGWSIETTVAHLFGTGWPKGKAQTKPAQETWWLARTGRSEALNIEACRVAATGERLGGGAEVHQKLSGGWARPWTNDPEASEAAAARKREAVEQASKAGRYPPNLLLSHAAGCVCEGTRRVVGNSPPSDTGSPTTANAYGKFSARSMVSHADPDGMEVVEVWGCVDGCPVAELDRQSGERTSGVKVGGGYANVGAFAAAKGGGLAADGTACYADSGTASRYFPQFPADDPDAPWSEALFRYVAKPSRAERNAGCDGMPEQLSNATGFDGASVAHRIGSDGKVTPKAIRGPAANHHPTVKSVALMRWLLRLVTKPGGVILDPFGGSGTTGVAALLEGRRVVLIEREPQYAAIARARCAAADGSEWAAPIVARPREVKPADARQPGLFDGRPL